MARYVIIDDKHPGLQDIYSITKIDVVQHRGYVDAGKDDDLLRIGPETWYLKVYTPEASFWLSSNTVTNIGLQRMKRDLQYRAGLMNETYPDRKSFIGAKPARGDIVHYSDPIGEGARSKGIYIVGADPYQWYPYYVKARNTRESNARWTWYLGGRSEFGSDAEFAAYKEYVSKVVYNDEVTE